MNVLFNEGKFLGELSTELQEKALFKLEPAHLEIMAREIPLAAAFQLGARKNNDRSYVMRVTKISQADIDTPVFSFKVSHVKGEGDDIGNFAIGLTFGKFENEDDGTTDMELFDECRYMKRVTESLKVNHSLGIQTDDMAAIISTYFQFIDKFLEENKSEDEPFTLDIPGVISYTVVFEDGKFFKVATADQEMKKRIKSDDMLEATK